MASRQPRQHLQRSEQLGLSGAQEQILRPMVAQLVGALLHPVDTCREANVSAFVRVSEPAAQALVIDALVDRLAAGDSRRDQVLATLSQFRHWTLPTLVLRFTRTRSAALQRDILTVFTHTANRLNSAQCGDLMLDLLTLSGFAADESVRTGIGKVMGLLRRAQGVAARMEGKVQKPPADENEPFIPCPRVESEPFIPCPRSDRSNF